MPYYANHRNANLNNLYSRADINNEELHAEKPRLLNGVIRGKDRAMVGEERYSEYSHTSDDYARGRKKDALLARYNRRHDRPDTDYNIYGDFATSVHTNIEKDLGKHWT